MPTTIGAYRAISMDYAKSDWRGYCPSKQFAKQHWHDNC